MEEVDNLQPIDSFLPLQLNFEYKIQHFPMKRIFDICFSLIVLFFGLPIFLIISLIIYFTSPGKIIFSHERIGRGGVPFRCYKFRTMYSDSTERLKIILKDPLLHEEWIKNYKLKKDPRITPIGAFLRKTSLDEIPQFWNVLKGDLSIVGPRPVIQEELQQYYHYKAYKILSIRPGLTGIWQVSGRNDVSSYETRVQMDEDYVDNRSFLLDLKLITKTIPAILFSKGAY